MNTASVQNLMAAAKVRMSNSHDPIHDQTHAKRTAGYTERLCHDAGIAETHTQALIVAAWWHDVARTITDKPSFIVMPFIDDLLSAIMLWWHALRTKNSCQTSNLAVRLIACKSIGTGALLTRILVRKRDRVLIDILHDADKLDFFNVERMAKVLAVTETSAIYRMGYRMSCRWYTLLNYIKVKTDAAQKYILQLLRQFLAWLKEPVIYLWHVENFGAPWSKKNLRRLDRMIGRLAREIASGVL